MIQKKFKSLCCLTMLLSAFFMLGGSIVWAQSGLTLNSTSLFGGSGDQRGTGLSISNGGIYVSGIVRDTSDSTAEALLLRYTTPPSPTPAWSRSWPYGVFYGVTSTSDAVYTVGYSYSLTTDTVGGKEIKSIVARFPADGTAGTDSGGATWIAKPHFFSYTGVEMLRGITTAVEGGNTYLYVVGGGQPCSYSAYFVAKYEASGNFLASATDSSVGINFGACFVPSIGGSGASGVTTLNGNVYVSGSTSWASEGDSSGRPVIWKYDSNLSLIQRWKDTSIWGVLNSVTTLGNAIYAVGFTYTPGVTGSEEYLIVKYDESGTMVWKMTFGGANTDVLNGVAAINGRLFAVGYTKSEGTGGAEAVIMEIDPTNGVTLSKTLYGGAQDDLANGVATDGNTLYVAGESRSFSTATGNAVDQSDVMLLNYSMAITDETAIQNMFAAAAAAFNNRNVDGVMAYFAPTYLNDGETYAMQRDKLINDLSGNPPALSPVVSNIVINGNNATATVVWAPGPDMTETVYLIKSNGNWLMNGNQQKYRVRAWSGYQANPSNPNRYWVDFEVDDPSDIIQSVTVMGNGLAAPATLYHNAANHQWSSWSMTGGNSVGPTFGNTLPTDLPYTYTFTITDTSETSTPTAQVSEFVTVLLASTSPAPNTNLTGTPTFTWAPVAGSYTYAVEVNGPNGHWGVYDLPSTVSSYTYDGPALTPGNYTYNISVRDNNGNFSMVSVPFTYGLTTTTITISGTVTDWNGAIIATTVSVSLAGDPTKTTTASSTDGSFSLPGLPANTPLSLRFSANGYLDVYSVDMSSSIDIDTSLGGSFNLPTLNDLTASGIAPAAGKGLIASRVSDNTYRKSSNVGGVVVTAQSMLHPSTPYPVTYRDSFGNLGGSATYGNGRYYVLNVDEGDTVNVSAFKNGWNFNPRTYHTHGNSVSEGKVYGVSPGYDASISGLVKRSDGTGIANAHMELNGDPGKFTDTTADGSYYFGNLPRDANFYSKITSAGYVPTFAGPYNLQGIVSGINIPMVTPTEMSGFGVATGNSLILCAMIDQTTGNPLSGATVTVVSKKGQSYTVSYDGGGISTSATGKFLLANVLPGDTVKIDIIKSGYNFASAYLDSFAGAVTAKYLRGTSATATGTISGRVSVNFAGYNDLAVMNATVSLQGTGFSAPTDIDGNFTLINIPLGNYTLVITAPNMAAETQNVSLTGQNLQVSLPPMVISQSNGLMGDANGDGRLGVDDAVYILQIISGIRQ